MAEGMRLVGDSQTLWCPQCLSGKVRPREPFLQPLFPSRNNHRTRQKVEALSPGNLSSFKHPGMHPKSAETISIPT